MMRLCSNLRRLEIDHIGDPLYSLELFNPKLEHVHIRNVYSESFLRSALNHFRDIESIALDRLGPSMISVLADTFESLPRLRDLCITYRAVSLNEKDYAKLLAAGGSNRWRKIDLPCLGLNVVAALAHHADTLEHLTVKKLDSNVDQSLVDLLASCTRIRYLHLHSHVFNAQTFIDYSNNLDGKQEEELEQLQQPQQQCRPLRPWKCEKTLVEFKARIGCIPRSDIPLNLLGKPHDDEGVCLSEIYPGQSHELQEQVMTRLGRFHNLQHIQLGLEDLTEDVRQRIKNSANHQGPPYDDPSYQYECLDMTLENGLGMLHQLRQLRHLNVGRMASRIGPKEVEWMIEHWPRLRVIEGLCPNEESKVKSKFQELAPHIQAIEFLPIV
ncbi:hypothetical protein BGW41_003659 [Actinomortierella wolfii]|nr:hypothetical protein BGW41_003659 [Actinomortierella wolfii]